jgi:hypothetical protein
MKKVLSLSLILIIIVALLSSCQQTNTVQKDYPRIIVAKEPSQSVHDAFKDYLGKYTDLQDALDEIVDRYNTTYDNDDLFNICAVLYNRSYFENANALIIEYYGKFFDEIWSNDEFNQKTTNVQEWYADMLLNAMYKNGMQMESIDFFDKYLATINDKDEKVFFSSNYVTNYFIDSNPEPSNEALLAILKRLREIEDECYNNVNDTNKARICGMISECAEILNDTETAETYKEKLRQLIQKMMNETSNE